MKAEVPHKVQGRDLPWIHLLLAITLVLTAAGLYRMLYPRYEAGVLFLSTRWAATVILSSALLLGEIVLLAALSLPLRERLLRLFEAFLAQFERLRRFNYLLFGVAAAGYGYVVAGRFGHLLLDPYVRWLAFWALTILGAFLLRAAGLRRSMGELLLASMVLCGGAHRLAAYATEVSAYPFSLGWSEASRYYYASLFFAERVYGLDIPPTVLHPSRYLMQSLPFLLPEAPLWLHRFWQVLLWMLTGFLAAWALARRLDITDGLRKLVFVVWGFLFLVLGPVYYHLLVPVIIVLWGYKRPNGRRRRFAWTTGIVLLASAWAGISRVNWFPVPAMIAACLYLLEEPVDGKGLIRYLWRPFVWGVAGTLTAFAAQALYALWSGNPSEQFTSSFTSDLLWYRLLPNPTYPAGILPASLIVSLPLLILAVSRMQSAGWRYHPFRLLSLGAALLVLYLGGLVVSVKIGGGSNLHNLDAYLALLLVVCSYIYVGKFQEEAETSDDFTEISEQARILPGSPHAAATLALVLFTPVFLALQLGAPLYLPPAEQTTAVLERLIREVQEASEEGEVLLISERHLLSVGAIADVPLVPDYEKVFLMEMAMAGNPIYLGRFEDDLQKHRFALIVTDPVFLNIKDREEVFSEENNAWVERVVRPLLCYYDAKRRIPEMPVQFLVPDDKAGECR